MKAFVIKYAEENVTQGDEKEIAVLRKASTILRRRNLQFIKNNPTKAESFKVAMTDTQQEYPAELTSFS